MVLVKRLALGLGLLGVADTALVLAIAGGINLGTLLPGAAGVVLVAWAALRPCARLDISFLHRWGLKTAAFGLFLLGAVSFVLVEGMMLLYAFGGGISEADWCIVLGAGLRGDRPSLTLRRRLDTALAYLLERPDTRVVVTGGRGPGETMTEAEAMRRWLVAHSVAPSRILVEAQAKSTIENLRYAKEVMAKAGRRDTERVCVVSNDFHLLRVRMLARRVGMAADTVAAPTPWYLLPNVCIREYFAIMKSFLLDR